MTTINSLGDPTLEARGLTIAQVTDLGSADAVAFEHAVALARTSESTLVSIHANDDPSVLGRMPHACELLARWGHLSRGARPGDERDLRMQHGSLVENCCDDTVDTLLSVLARTKPDLLVTATNARDTARRVLAGSIAEALAREVTAPTLLVPAGSRPFISAEHGTLSLSRILVAAGDERAARIGLSRALWFADVAGAGPLEIELFHAGDATPAPELPVVERADTRLSVHHVARGLLDAQLAARADAWPAELIVMATRGHDSLRDFWSGSYAERTLHRAPCPLLSVPLV
jgi:nucleotide-binding universal stress UspA family protein